MWLVKVYEVCPKASYYLGDQAWVSSQREAKRFSTRLGAQLAALAHDNVSIVRLKTRTVRARTGE